MKGFGVLVMAALAGLAGYVFEPVLRPVLTPAAKAPADQPAPPSVEPAPPVVAEPAPPVPAEPAPQETPVTPPVETPVQPAEETTPPPPVEEPAVEPETAPESVPEPAQPQPAEKPSLDLPAPSGFTPIESNGAEAAAQPAVDPNSPVILAMKQSFEQDGIREFANTRAAGMAPGGEETVDGKIYQIGWLDFESSTIFGNKITRAKAYLVDGKVVKWVAEATGHTLK